jgi:hypothetical protein
MGAGVRRDFASRPAVAFKQNRRFFQRCENPRFSHRDEDRRFSDCDHRVFFQPFVWPVYWYHYGYPYGYSYLDYGPDYQYRDNSAAPVPPGNPPNPPSIILRLLQSSTQAIPGPGIQGPILGTSIPATVQVMQQRNKE